MKGLTKENCWDAIEQKHPVAFKHFMDWLDQWKEANGVVELKRTVTVGIRGDGGVVTSIKPYKFHDWPFEMQIGIITLYAEAQLEGPVKQGEDALSEVYEAASQQMLETFGEIEEALTCTD